MALTPGQRQVVQLAIAKSQGASQRVRRSLLEALAVESSFRNLPYGDRDSQGVLQQRPSQGWGAPGNPAQDIAQYLARANALDRSGFKGTAGQLAQAVQRSAFPGRYDQHRGEAISLLSQFGASGASDVPGSGAQALGNPGLPGGSDPRRQIALALLNPKLRADPLALVQAIKGFRNQGSPAADASVSQPQTSAPTGSYYRVAPGADRPGVNLSPDVLRFVSGLGQRAGHPITIGTGTNHNEYVLGTHRESQHWTGHAADIPATGAELIRLGRLALLQAGMPAARAAKAPGGLYNVNGVQVIFGVKGQQFGGDHTNHLHVGVR